MKERLSSKPLRAPLVALAIAVTGACLPGSMPMPHTPGAEQLPAGKQSANEQLVVAQLRTIKTAEARYFAEHGAYGAMEELRASGALNQSPQGLGYTIDLTLSDDGGYFVMAVPNEYGPSGRRSFYLDESGVIRGADHGGGAPGPDDPVVQ